jgi:Ran GTPase-activating protein (RanGAP) involved in mRNA processing and transport
MTDSSNQQIISKTAVKDAVKEVVKEVVKDVTKDSAIIAGNNLEKEAVKEVVKGVVNEVVNPNSIRMDTADDAIELTQKLYDKVYGTLQYMSSMTNKVNRFDRITNQEMHIVSKLHRFLNETLMEIKENPSAGEDMVFWVLC